MGNRLDAFKSALLRQAQTPRILAAVVAIASLPATVSASEMSVSRAIAAADAYLQENGSGLVDRYESCPSNDRTQWGHVFIHGVEARPVDGSTDAILIDTGQCSGGNEHGQYLVLASPSGARLILTEVLGDMRFIADRYSVDGSLLRLSGVRWLENDPHCCPSEKGTVSYDLRSGRMKYQRD